MKYIALIGPAVENVSRLMEACGLKYARIDELDEETRHALWRRVD